LTSAHTIACCAQSMSIGVCVLARRSDGASTIDPKMPLRSKPSISMDRATVFLMRPGHPPIGLHLARAARLVSRSFDGALTEAGGSLPVWLVLLNLKTRSIANQRALADAVGIREATLTHHLNAMETAGLITRQRSDTSRRVHVVKITEPGEEAFLRLRDAAIAFDRRLRGGLNVEEIAALRELLDRLEVNVGANEDRDPPWAGLAEAAT